MRSLEIISKKNFGRVLQGLLLGALVCLPTVT
jgi:hypothetical protein